MKNINITSKDLLFFRRYVDDYQSWEASETIYDEDHALWTMQSTENPRHTISLFKDKHTMVVYGIDGSLVFDKMLHLKDIHSMKYSNLRHQLEKLSTESIRNLMLFQDHSCEEDILTWVEDRLESDYVLSGDEIKDILRIVRTTYSERPQSEIADYCKDRGLLDSIQNLMLFSIHAMRYANEEEWIACLYSPEFKTYGIHTPKEFYEFGKRLDHKFYSIMAALKVCSDKILKKQAMDTESVSADEEIAIPVLSSIKKNKKKRGKINKKEEREHGCS